VATSKQGAATGGATTRRGGERYLKKNESSKWGVAMRGSSKWGTRMWSSNAGE